MSPTAESEVREMLRRRANAFSMAPRPPRVVMRRARWRRLRNVTFGTTAIASIGVVVTMLVGGIGASTAPRDYGQVGSSSSDTYVKLINYLLPDSRVGDPAATTPGPELTDHIECMRAQGFDIPDPVRTTEGWSIIVDPEVVDVGSSAWREAAFVTCRLPVRTSGNFIMGLSKDRVDHFVACVREQGFDLPEPTLNDEGEYVFDLTETNIDMNAAEWNRVAFVTCSPDVGP